MAEVVLKVNKQYENVSTPSRTWTWTSPTASSWSWSARPAAASTALRMVAGLEDISSGTLRIGERVVNTLSPKDRDIAMVFQSYALYPHMSVADNIAYGLKIRRKDKAEIDRSSSRSPRCWSLGRCWSASLGSFRRPAPVGSHGPGHRPRAPGVPDGRAPVQPGRQAAGPDARDRPGPARLERDHIYVTHDQTEAMTMATGWR